MPSKGDQHTGDEVKEGIQAGHHGGAPGELSTRKSHMMASEYKKREQMNEKGKSGTEEKNPGKGKEDSQNVANTSKVKSARKDSSHSHEDAEAKPNVSNHGKDATECTQHWEDEQRMEKGQKAYQEFKKQNRNNEAASEAVQSESGSDEQPKKRGRGANAPESNKKQKKAGGSGGPNGSAGDKTRVPKVGQKVQWHALPGYVDGEVVEVVYEEKRVEGKAVKASMEDPRIVLKSSSSGKIAVHKPEAVYFD